MTQSAEAAKATIEALLAAGASLQAAEHDGASPLHCAAVNLNAEAAAAAIQALVAAGSAVEAGTNSGQVGLFGGG